MNVNKEEIREHIRKTYSKVATQKSAGCCAGGCSCETDVLNFTEDDIEEVSKKIGYSTEDLKSMPEKANMGLGCGNPTAIASLKEGEIVLDLGSGGGFDCFLARKQVGETGTVIGVDMTHDMLKLSRDNVKKLGYTNVEFRLGEIENLPVADLSVDVIISNCVINLSQEKNKVFKEAYRVLKNGGRLLVSDVVATAKLPEDIKNDLSMMSGCIAGAEYVENIRNILQETGFINIKLTPKDNSKEIIHSWVPNKNVEDYVASYIIEGSKAKI
ncbi:MAG: arsenite methyltransferase [Clostridia bacterium]|nr:arsenite methyltransferase [Clostridia bacterium]MDD4387060.1 arsenite methyltransferase [Clostridia bacterium]